MRAALLLLLFTPALLAAEDLNVLPADGKVPPRKMLQTYLLAECQKHFDARKAEVAALKTADDVKNRNEQLRAKFIEALGGFPEKTPLNPQVTGTIRREGFRIEKVIFESRPNHHVTANLYIPDGKGPFPVVLMPIGHSANGKASFQLTASLLAKNGIAAFPYDPISQGERRQLLDEEGKPFIPSMTAEHSLIGVGALLVGRCTASYRIWDGIRALDYLCSRPEIDATKIGCTGCSGGGTLTSYLMALDDRILAAAPSCYLTTLEKLFNTIGPQDAEQNIPGQVAFHMDHADYILMRAPKPTLIIACTKDFFNIEGTWATFREAKQVYTKLGYPERIEIVEADSTHGYPKAHREAMLRFMSRWLLGKDKVIVEEPVELVKESELQCTRTGQVLEEFKGKSCFDLNREGLESKKTLISSSLTLDKPGSMKEVGKLERMGYQVRKVIVGPEPLSAGLWFEPGGKANGNIIFWVNGRGKAADAAVGGPIEKLVLAGNRVFALDLPGFGETAVTPPSDKPGYFGTDFTVSFLASHLGYSLLGLRAVGLVQAIDAVSRETKDEIQLIGIGSAAPAALQAARWDERVKGTTIEKGLIAWGNVVDNPLSIDQLTNMRWHGAKRGDDLPDMAKAIAARGVTIRNAIDATGKPVPIEKVKKLYGDKVTVE